MIYRAELFARKLRQARLQKGWTQRELSAKARIPQAHISRIESGAVDVKLSTLVELARLLDLELVLAPRAALPAVEGLIREAEANLNLRSARSLVDALQPLLRRLRLEHPRSHATDRLERIIADFEAIAPLFRSPRALDQLQDAVLHIQRAGEKSSDDLERLDAAIDGLAGVRNALVQAGAPLQRPAYSLDEED